MGVSLANPWVRAAGGLAMLASLPACQTTLTPNEGRVLGGAAGAVFGEVLGRGIEDRRLRNVVTGGAAAAGATLGGAAAAQAGYCDQYDRTTRTASRDNRTGAVERDRTTQTRDEECSRRIPHRGGPRPGQIFN